jgi:carboxyl-terminal processing protease
MKSKQKKYIPLSTAFIVVVLGLVVGFIGGTRKNEILSLIGPVVGYSVEENSIDLSSVENTYSVLKDNFDGDLNKEKLIEGASKGLVEAAGDKYTTYMDSDEAEAFNKELSGDVGAGIGAEIGLRNDVPTVIRPLKDNPAIKAGILAGDIVVEVNGESTSGWTVEQVTSKIKGDAGTTVKIKVLRGEEYKEFSVVREKINNPSVELEINDGIAILKISRFDNETGTLAKEYANQIKDKNISKVILDLRGNGGGYVSAAKDVASLWLDKNATIVTEKSSGKVVDEIKATGNNTLSGIKTIVLANEYSASASEIVIGALKDNNVATIMGVKSYGKGSVQQPIDINGGSLLKVTVARWYTPSGANITDEGIKPDVEVNITTEDINKGDDPQMASAKKELNK